MEKNYFDSILGSEYEMTDSEISNSFLVPDKQRIKHLKKKLKKNQEEKGKECAKKIKKAYSKIGKKAENAF